MIRGGALCCAMALLLILSPHGCVASNYKALGCYTDVPAGSDLNGCSAAMQNISLNACVAYCAKYGFPYSGLEARTVCNCGDTYGTEGASNNCTATCGGTTCGGGGANSVYYTSDTTVAGLILSPQAGPLNYTMARRACVTNLGDLAAPSSAQVISSIVALWGANSTSVTQVWVGLHIRPPSTVYEWTDANQNSYTSMSASLASYWTVGDPGAPGAAGTPGQCVSLILATSKLSSTKACSTALPFVCTQPPVTTPGGPTTDESPSASQSTTNGQKLALYIVLPIFLACYGGSCLLYCIHKIIKNCSRKHPPKMRLDNVEGGLPPGGAREKRPMPYSDNPPKRPLSASRRIYPAPPPPLDPAGVGGISLPTKAMPVYIPQPGGPGGPKLSPQYNPDEPPVTSRGVQLDSLTGAPPGPPGLPGPPAYADEKRARLLENAAREARERRAKEEADGRPPSNLFVPPKRENSLPPAAPAAHPPTPPSPERTGSTTNLLGKGAKGGGEDESNPNDQMSINEILRKKVQQEKKKPKKVTNS